MVDGREEIVTGQVVLRRVVEPDLPVFYEQQRDPLAAEMAAFPMRAREPFLEHWKTVLANPAAITRTILFEGRVAGNIGAWDDDGEREVGYWLGQGFWGKGIATEALRLFVEELPQRPLYAHVATTNIASRRVLEKCGFRLLREDNGYSRVPGEEIAEFVMIRED